MSEAIRQVLSGGIDWLIVGNQTIRLALVGPITVVGEFVHIHVIGIGDVATSATKQQWDAYIANGSPPDAPVPAGLVAQWSGASDKIPPGWGAQDPAKKAVSIVKL